MYYLLILISVLMFGGNFALNDLYRRKQGNSLKISLQFSLITALAGTLFLLAVNKFTFEYTPFTLLMGAASALNSIAFTFCSFKALGSIDLSLFSLYSMLGGMVLPFLQGILFYGEALTVAKILCLLLITAALLLTVNKKVKKGGAIYYAGIFILNGMAGVISKLFTSAPFPKADAASFSILSALCSVALSGGILLLWRKGEPTPKNTLPSLGIGTLAGILSRLANFILVIALAHVDASVQYPMVTGGVMIVSTALCYFTEKKPTKKEMFSVLLAFFGMLALFLIPV